MKAKFLAMCIVLAVVMSMLCSMPVSAATSARDDIKEKILIAEELQQELYQPKSWETLQKAISEAKPYAEPSHGTEDEAKAKLIALGDAIVGLRMLANCEVLEAAISITGFLDKTEYTQASWNNLLSAMSEAKTVKADVNADQARVDLAQKRLTIAVSKLVKLNGEKYPGYQNASKDIDKSVLDAAVYNVSLYKESYFSSDAYTIYKYTVSVAENILKNSEAKQSQIDMIQADLILGLYYMQKEPAQLALLAKELLELPAALRPEPPKEVVDAANNAPDTDPGNTASDTEQTSSTRRVTKKVLITKPGKPADYTWLYILFGVGAGVLAIAAVIVIIILVRRKKKENLEA